MQITLNKILVYPEEKKAIPATRTVHLVIKKIMQRKTDQLPRVVATAAWALMLLVQFTFELFATFPVLINGIDISASIYQGHLWAFLWILVGLLLALIARKTPRFSNELVFTSAAIFMIIWFPWKSMRIVGVFDILKFKWSLTSTHIDQAIFFVREIFIPLGFIFSLAYSAFLIMVNKSRRSD